MNILVFSWRDIRHPLAGGAEQVDHEHHKGWIAGGHSVTLFTSIFPGAKQTEEIDGVRVIRSGNQILGVHLNAFIWYLFKKHKDFDLVVDEFHGIPFFTPLYIWKPKLAILQEVASKVWLKNDLHFPLNLLVGYLGYFFEPLIFIPYWRTKFMVGSNSAKEQLSSFKIIVKENISVIPHGVILELQKSKLKKEKEKTVVFLGALAKDKGIEDAIKCFAILNKENNFKFWIIGKGGEDYVKKLKNMCKEFGISGKTFFWGFVSQKQKFELLERSHVMVNPSLLEGFGLVNIEANACGVPVVAYNSSGLTDSVKDGISGIIVKNNTPEDLAFEIKKMFDGEKYKKFQENTKIWSKNFDWKIAKQKSLELINKIFDEK